MTENWDQGGCLVQGERKQEVQQNPDRGHGHGVDCAPEGSPCSELNSTKTCFDLKFEAEHEWEPVQDRPLRWGGE